MKIVDRKTFLALPPETLFAKYEPCAFEDLCIKGETWGDDFLVQDITGSIECCDSNEFVNRLDHSEATEESVPMDFECTGRDGCFDEGQLFAVWEPNDVRALIERLGRCLPNAEPIHGEKDA